MPLADLLARRRAAKPVPPTSVAGGTANPEGNQSGSLCSPGSLPKLETPSELQDDRDERAAIVEHEGSVPREWAEAYASLLAMPRPEGITEARWRLLLDDAGRFLDGWAHEASALGWAASDVWTCRLPPAASDLPSLGLVGVLNGRRVVAITEACATIAADNGAPPTVYRRPTASQTVWRWQPAQEVCA